MCVYVSCDPSAFPVALPGIWRQMRGSQLPPKHAVCDEHRRFSENTTSGSSKRSCPAPSWANEWCQAARFSRLPAFDSGDKRIIQMIDMIAGEHPMVWYFNPPLHCHTNYPVHIWKTHRAQIILDMSVFRHGITRFWLPFTLRYGNVTHPAFSDGSPNPGSSLQKSRVDVTW